MENLNAEQIKKALEWCSELRLCVDCPMRAEGYFSHSGNACRKALMENALALIKSQEQRIEACRMELAEARVALNDANNRLKECENGYEGTLHLERAKIKELTEENNRLVVSEVGEIAVAREIVYRVRNEHPVVVAIRADTVRKMQERLTKEFDRMHKSNFITVEVRQWIIDQIAKEMLEGKK